MAGMRTQVSADLYHQARGGNGNAWFKLTDHAIPGLIRWLESRGIALPRSQLEEVSEDAFSLTGSKFQSIPTWPQAWNYLKKTSYSLAHRRLHRWSKTIALSDLPVEPVDPQWEICILQAEFEDLVSVFLRHVSKGDKSLMLSEIDAAASQTAQSIRERAAACGFSPSTFKRHLKILKRYCAEWYDRHG